jgi:hypothetical protein
LGVGQQITQQTIENKEQHNTGMLFVLLVLLAVVAHSTSAWKEAKEIRLPLELRIVNEGLAHDDEHWFLSNQHFLFKTTVSPMEIVTANYHAIPSELGKRRYDHIGDIDVLDGEH